MNRSRVTQRGLVLLLVVSTFCPALQGGFRPEQQVISTAAHGANSVYAADLDGDGDIDVLSASSEDDRIAWYPNDGTGHFGPQQVITTAADMAICVYAADLDGDGDLDVLSASYWSDGENAYAVIAWYANDGTGHFGPQQIITTTAAAGAESVYAADLDGDGDLDVLSASSGYYPSYNGKIAWYANDGTGQFGPQQIITTAAAGAESIYAADLDGDGDLDVLSASSGYYPSYNGKIAWYANDGTGQFGPQQVITAGYGASCVYAADLDGDGDLDVLSASYEIAWYANDGTGQFGPRQVVSTEVRGVSCVYAADLDGDGDLDVLSASSGDDKIAWYANGGTGQFGPQQVISTDALGARCVYVADLDGDGDLDVLSASLEDDKIAWYANDGTGHFGSQRVVTTEAAGANCVYAADLDGDGDLDVLAASSNDNKIAWYANDGSGNFGPQQVISTDAWRASCVYAADLDGDGDLDVLSASYGVWTGDRWTDCKIAWYANDGTGHFGPQQVITTEADGATCVYAADLDGGGDLDVLSASEGDGKVAWYANDGTGHFGPQQVITTEGGAPSCVYATDLDGDGDLDVLSASYWGDGENAYAAIAWYANDGTGHFGPWQVIMTEQYFAGVYADSVYAADLDGDGDLDVLSTFYWVKGGTDGPYSSSTIAWYPNDGTGHFGPEQVITTATERVNCVYAADLDADGDLDVLSALAEVWVIGVPSTTSKIAWHANDGTGQFGPQQVITTAAEGAESVYAADLDGDGDTDVLSASSEDDKIAWYENDTAPEFSDEQVITTEADEAQCVYAADLDGDGDLDVLSASLADVDNIAWYANNGTGHFGPQQVIATAPSGALCVYAADLDGDGDLDVLSTSNVPFSDMICGHCSDTTIAYYANDGSGHFGPQQVITACAPGASSVYAADLDGDGDLDVLSASSGGYRHAEIAWYANDGKGHFGPQQVISTEAPGAMSVYAADLDGDLDLDVLSGGNSITWYLNDGSGHFGDPQAIAKEDWSVSAAYATDLDGDGDVDVLCATAFVGYFGTLGGKIAWYANDGSGHFGDEQVIATEDFGAETAYAADLNGDGDLDVLSALYFEGEGYGGSKIAWYVNDGTNHFGPQQVISAVDGANCVYAADLDGDGDLDVLSASSEDDKIAWYENE